MITHKKDCGLITIDLESGGQFGIEFDCSLTGCPAEGDGWNEPRVPAHWEIDDVEPTALIVMHPDGTETYLPAPPGSILYQYTKGILDRQSTESLQEAVEET